MGYFCEKLKGENILKQFMIGLTSLRGKALEANIHQKQAAFNKIWGGGESSFSL